MKNRVVVNEDRISELPEALILQILSLLPTKSAIATSVLSKQWRFLWEMMPELKFDSCDHRGELGTFSEYVYKSLLSHKAPILESLHLNISARSIDYRDTERDIETWIVIARARHLRNLVIDVEHASVFNRFSKSLYNYETLETMILKICVFVVDPSQVCLKSLKTLHLDSALFKNEASFVNLLSGCPNLENLLLDILVTPPVDTFTIAVPSLQRLSIYSNHGGHGYVVNHGGHGYVVNHDGHGYVVHAPSLKYLKIEGDHGFRFRLTENVTKLVEANIIIVDVSRRINKSLLGSLTSVKRLSLELLSLEIKFPIGSIFYQLVHLELYTSDKAWCNLLAFMLDSSPKLQVLKLISSQNRGGWRKDYMADGKWNQLKNVPECLLFNLETFMWSGYNECLVKEEKKAAKYILTNANLLKRAIFSSERISSEDRLELESVVRASNSCQLLFN